MSLSLQPAHFDLPVVATESGCRRSSVCAASVWHEDASESRCRSAGLYADGNGSRAFMSYVDELLPGLANEYLPVQETWCPAIDILAHYQRTYQESWYKLIKYKEAYESCVDLGKIEKAISQDTRAIVKLLCEALEDPITYKQYFATGHNYSQALLDLLQEIIQLDVFLEHLGLFLKALLKLSGSSGLYPESFTLSNVQFLGAHPIAGGSFADVWKGKVADQVVAIKMVRMFDDSDKISLIKVFLKEALIWGQLRHPNLLPFLGLFFVDERLCFASPWMENNNLVKFLQANPSANRMVLAHDIAHGLAFLHANQIVHGDLKGANVMITGQFRACIADFGLSKIASSFAQRWTSFASTSTGGTVRWQAPELFMYGTSNTFMTDIYALGCVFYELFSGNVPFYYLSADPAVIVEVISGSRPQRPDSQTGMTDAFWNLIQSCWFTHPELRPSSDAVVDTIHCQGGCGNCLSSLSAKTALPDARQLSRKYSILPTFDEIEVYLGELPIPASELRQYALLTLRARRWSRDFCQTKFKYVE